LKQAHKEITDPTVNSFRFTDLLGQEILVNAKHNSIKVTGRDGAETFGRVFKKRRLSLDEKESGSHSFGSRSARASRASQFGKKGQDAQLAASCSS
jgi:hypothetical protein